MPSTLQGHYLLNLVTKAIGHKPYELHVVACAGGPVIGYSGLPVETAPIGNETFDTVVFVGGEIEPMRTVEHITTAKQLALKISRVASVCTGAFLLAEIGLLNDRRATTHWYHISELQSQFPRINIEGDNIYIEDRGVWTSAGIASGIDLALAIIEKDMGATVARDVSR
ncbi:AraC family transcriptional regulator [Pseudomonas sp. SH1-B]